MGGSKTECPHALVVVGAEGRGELTCSRCIELFDAVEETTASDRTLEALRCDDVRRMVDELGHRSPRVAQLAVARLHLACCGECAEHALDARLTADLEPGEDARDARFDSGQMLGRFVITGKLGEGGMGVVISAHDPNLDRLVAIKVVHASYAAGPTAEHATRRLLREAQAMARIHHPNVITVYEVGKFDDVVFIAMDLVDGGTLAAWLDARPRRWDQILAVYLKAGAGLAAAHAAGLIHRDFKPDNVLVSRGDDHVYVTDFGIVGADRPHDSLAEARAAATSPNGRRPTAPIRALASSSLTQTGQLMGTPRYMSPEQHRGFDTDARSDQFSFCVALWEALYGALPFPGANYLALATNVCAGELVEPPRDAAVPAWIKPVLVRGLSRNPGERYPTMQALLAQLQSRMKKRREPLIAAIACGAALIAGTSFYALRADGAQPALCPAATEQAAAIWNPETRDAIEQRFAATGRAYASDTFHRLVPAVDHYLAQWAEMQGEACTAARHGHETPEMLDRRSSCLDRRREAVQTLIRLWRTADDDVVASAIDSVKRLPPIAECTSSAITAASAERVDDPAKLALLVPLRPKLASATALLRVGKYRTGIEIMTLVVAAAQPIGFDPFIAESALVLGELEWRAGDMKAAVAALELGQQAAYASDHHRLEVATAIELTYVTGTEQQDFERAQFWAQHARAGLRKLGGDARLEAQLLRNLGTTSFKAERFDDALAYDLASMKLRERIFGADSVEVAESLRGVGTVYIGMEEPLEARAHLQKALDIATRVYGDQHPELADYLNNLGAAYSAAGDTEQAMKCLTRSLVLREQALGPDHVGLADTLTNLGTLECEENHCDEAIPLYERAAKLEQTTHGASYPGLGVTLMLLGSARAKVGQPEQAMADLRRAIAIDREAGSKQLGIALALAGNVGFELARAEWSRGHRVAAVDLAKHARADLVEAGDAADDDSLAELDRWLDGRR